MSLLDSEVATLLANQENLGEAIGKAFTNFSKANHSQKNKLTYVSNKLQEVQELFKVFEENNAELLKLEEKSVPYFEKNYFEEIKKLFKKHFKVMFDHQQQLIVSLSEKDDKGSSIFKIQKIQFQVLDKMLEEPSNYDNVGSFELQYEDIHAVFNKVSRNNEAILDIVVNLDSIPEEIGYEAYEMLKKKTFVKLGELKSKINNLKEFTATKRHSDDDKMPKIEIPKFDGNYVKWPAFKKLFEEFVHKRDISDIRKMVYLQQNLTGSAAGILGRIEPGKENYNDVWKRLVNTYDNKRKLTKITTNRFFQQSDVKENSVSSLRHFYNVTEECLVSFKSLGITFENCEAVIVFLLLKKLDDRTRELFEIQTKKPKENPTLESLLEFLEHRTETMDNCEKISKHKNFKTSHSISNNDNESAEAKDKSKKGKVCFICKKEGHFASSCKFKKPLKEKLEISETPLLSNSKVFLATSKERESDFLFLGTVILNAIGHQGKIIECRALLDNGSQANFITESLAKKLGLKPILRNANISGIASMGSFKTRKCLCVEIISQNSSYRKVIEFVVIPEISVYSPNENFDFTNVMVKRGISVPLADPHFNKSRTIDLLLNVQVYVETRLNNEIRLGDNYPTLLENKFGWIVFGHFRNNNSASLFCGVSCVDHLCDIPNLWQLDNPINSHFYTYEEKEVENLFEDTTTRDSSGRFVVELPKKSLENIGESLYIAKTRFKHLERRFAKNNQLFIDYKAFLQEYLDLGHMTRINFEEIPKIHYFLPHHPVFKLDSSTTKLRVVFDASAKTSTNISLNDCLMNGPQIQDDLFSILIRFRFPRYVFSGDLAKMFRQIKIIDSDQYLCLILWRNHPSENLSVFKLSTVTYGTKSASYLATKCLQKISKDISVSHPEVSNVIEKSFYIDDGFSRSDSLKETRNLIEKLNFILSKYGFHIRK